MIIKPQLGTRYSLRTEQYVEETVIVVDDTPTAHIASEPVCGTVVRTPKLKGTACRVEVITGSRAKQKVMALLSDLYGLDH